jgi:cytochrome c553
MKALAIVLALCVAGLLAFIIVGRTGPAAAAAPAPAAAAGSAIARGKYLVTVIACNDCHSPHDQTGKVIAGKELSGHPENAPLPEWDPSLFKRNVVATFDPTMTAFAGPFGVSVAPNITPDLETGLVVSAEGLIQSWRTGNHWKFNRPVLPPMPMESFKTLSDEDIRAIYAYLMSVPAVKNKAPDSVVGPPPGAPAAPPAGASK